MTESYRKIGELISVIDNRNINGDISKLIGISIDKCYIPSVANVIGTDLRNYKVIRKGEFACSLMQVSRDQRIPLAMYPYDDPAIMSPAYVMFEVNNPNTILPEYMELWFMRAEFDREASFYAVGGVRGSLDWEDFCNMKLPVPPISEQRKIVHDYQVITDRIELLRKMNENLEKQAELRFSNLMDSSNGAEGFFSDVIKIMGGGTPSTTVNGYWNGRIPFFTPGDIDGVFCFSTDKTLTDEGLANCSSKEYPVKTTFITCRGTVGKVAMAGVPMAMNQTCYALTGKGNYPDYFVYEFVKYFVNSIKRKANGGVFDAITTKDFETEKVNIPTIEQALALEKSIAPAFTVIFDNQREMVTLECVRALMMTAITQRGA